MLNLLNTLLTRLDAGEPVALCVLVRARGSTPQATGAMMLVLASGETLGTLGGGCVEAEMRTREKPSSRVVRMPKTQSASWRACQKAAKYCGSHWPSESIWKVQAEPRSMASS